MKPESAPTYSLQVIQTAVRKGHYWVTRTAAQGAGDLYLDEEDIKDCVLGLEGRDFYKTLPSHRHKGMFQDVYKCRYCGFAIYLKLQLSVQGAGVVISFKRDERA